MQVMACTGTNRTIGDRGRPAAVLLLLVGLWLAVPTAAAWSQQYTSLLDLRGRWKFEVGDDTAWAAPQLNDGKWDDIVVPSQWEDRGYAGYDGFAWYRKRFVAPAAAPPGALYLSAGFIDDADEVYLNGVLVGFQGSFPPSYFTAYDVRRQYPIPRDLVRWGRENVIAVRVYDDQMGGGITGGDVGLFYDPNALVPQWPLIGAWRFKVGDNNAFAQPQFDDSRWGGIRVPAYWEGQGYRDYDGRAWYRLRFTIPPAARGKDLVLLLGKIDDADETFLDGRRIGQTGDVDRRRRPDELGETYAKLRAYRIPADIAQAGGEHVLAVRVYDGFLHGGIYDGPIGLIEHAPYAAWRPSGPQKEGPLRQLLRFLFE